MPFHHISTASAHDWPTAYLLAYLCHVIYLDKLRIKHTETRKAKQHAFRLHFQSLSVQPNKLTYHEHPATNTQSLILDLPHATAVCFRGTENKAGPTSFFKDWLATNANTRLTQVPHLAPSARAHAGFYKAATLGTAKTLRTIQAINRAHAEQGHAQPKPLILTGHSLGGAVATLFALNLQTQHNRHVTALYTYGSPRPGNPTLANAIDNAITNHQRWVNKNDLVTYIPLGTDARDYTHLRTLRERLRIPATNIEYAHAGNLNLITGPKPGDVSLNHPSMPLYIPDARPHRTISYLTRIRQNVPEHQRKHLPEARYKHDPIPTTLRSAPPPTTRL